MRDKNVSLDPTLIFERFRRGEEGAFSVLYGHYFPKLFLIIREYVGRDDAAEDIVSNAFIKLYNRRARIREAGHVYGFLFVVARNEAVEYRRDQKRWRSVRADQEVLADREYQDPLEAEVEGNVQMLKIRRMIEELPAARKLIFELHFFKGLSVREIANQLDLSEITIRNQRNRALSYLRQGFLV